MGQGFLRFLNLEFWYCVVYSIFGGRCAPVEPIDASVSAHGPYAGLFAALIGGAVAVWQVVGSVLHGVWSVYSTLAYSVSGILFVSIISSLGGLVYLRYTELKNYGRLPPEPAGAHHLRARWQELLDRAMSTNPKEWRESIIAADMLLGELLENLGYRGRHTAEKLKNISEGAFVTLPAAWEAHRVRNFVSQGSSDFILTQRETFRVMKLYEQVFEEFKFV
jgi:hypothetical protein